MKLKKYLRKMAEIDADKLLNEKDEMYIQKMLQYQVPQAAVRRKFTQTTAFRAIIGSIVSAAILSVIIFPSIFVNNTPKTIRYFDYNIKEQVCSYEEMLLNINYFQIVENSANKFRIYLNYDSISGDKLYYTIDGNLTLANFTIQVDINKNYNIKFKLGEDISYKQLSDYTIKYEKVEMSDTNPNTVNYKGVIEISSEIVYIEYRQLVDLGEQTFFDDVQSVVKAKK